MRQKLRPYGKFLSIRQAEAEYAIPFLRLWEWVREGKLPHLDDGRRSYLIRRSDLDKFIADNMTRVR